MFKPWHFLISLTVLAACAAPSKQPAPPAESAPPVVVQPISAAPEKPHNTPAKKQQSVQKEERTLVMGWVEKARVGSARLPMKAKLDSGAKTSSIDAEIVKTFKKEGKRYVLYRVWVDEERSEMFESRIIRMVRIKKKEGGFIRRPVVKMEFCLGNRVIHEEVNLSDRAHFNYPVLVGRNMLEHANILVDTSKTYTHPPKCKTSEKTSKQGT
jgi:hypothetical protein